MDSLALKHLFSVLDARRAGTPATIELRETDLRGAHLLRADLVGADLRSAHLDFATLSGAKLGNAQLQNACLERVDLNGADLTDADLSGANLEQARLEGACLAGANLTGANLSGMRGEPASWVGARMDFAACELSGLDDRGVIALWRAGTELVGLSEFSERVQHACGATAVSASIRALATAELKERRARVSHQQSQPPSSLYVEELRMLSLPPGLDAPSRPPPSLRPRAPDSELPGIVIADRREGDEVLGAWLKRRMARGMHSETWFGMDSNGAKAVIKFFNLRSYSSGTCSAAFRRSVRTLNRLNQMDAAEAPPVVSVLANDLNGLAYVMPYHANGNLESLPALNLKTRQLVDFFIKLCKGVEKLHDSGVIHRCLKPSNVLLSEDLEPILADVDVADLPSLAAESGDLRGYRAYSAPEEVLGSGTQSPTVDIYSLGRLFHFLLLGETPEDAVEEVPTLESLAKQPSGLVRIVRKATLLDPPARYQWVASLIEDLENYEQFESVGLAGEIETNFLPYQISSLPPTRGPTFEVGPYAEPPRAAEPPATPLAVQAKWISRPTEKRIGAAGIVGMLAVLAAGGLTPVPDQRLGTVLTVAVILSLAMATLLLPRPKKQFVALRLSAIALVASCLLVAEPAQLLVYRLRLTAQQADLGTRARAVNELTRLGARDLSGLNLEKADLSGADLAQANFRGANLRQAKLTAAALMEAELGGADLTEADVRGADLVGSTASLARGWSSATCDHLTTLPEKWYCDAGHPKQVE